MSRHVERGLKNLLKAIDNIDVILFKDEAAIILKGRQQINEVLQHYLSHKDNIKEVVNVLRDCRKRSKEQKEKENG